MSATPAVSVLLPVHDGEAYLAASMESILGQTHRDLELIVLDDGSKDGSRAVAQRYSDPRVRVVARDENRGLIATLNEGLGLVRAPLVARQDADDVSHPSRLEWQAAYLGAHPEVALLGGEARVVDAQGRPRRRVRLPREDGSIRWFHLFDNAFVHSTVMFRTAAVRDALGGYGAFPHCEDFELWSRVMAAHRVANLPQEVLKRRVHPRSVLRTLGTEGTDRAALGNVAIITRNLAALFPDGRYTSADARLLAKLRTGVPPDDLPAFHALFDRLRKDYPAVRPDAAASPDFARTLALQYATLARGLMRSRPGAAAGAALRAVGHDAPVTAALAWEVLTRRTGAVS